MKISSPEFQFLSQYRGMGTACQCGSAVHIWGQESQIAVVSLFIDMIGKIPFHTTHEMTVMN